MLFLRFTVTPVEDLERGTSIHASNWLPKEYSIEEVCEFMGVEPENVGIWDGYYCCILSGLCGYKLESEVIEEAIEEVEEMIEHNKKNLKLGDMNFPVIFEGEDCYENIPDGDLFDPIAILQIGL